MYEGRRQYVPGTASKNARQRREIHKLSLLTMKDRLRLITSFQLVDAVGAIR